MRKNPDSTRPTSKKCNNPSSTRQREGLTKAGRQNSPTLSDPCDRHWAKKPNKTKQKWFDVEFAMRNFTTQKSERRGKCRVCFTLVSKATFFNAYKSKSERQKPTFLRSDHDSIAVKETKHCGTKLSRHLR